MTEMDVLPMRLGEFLVNSRDHEWEEELYVTDRPEQWTSHTPCAAYPNGLEDNPEDFTYDGHLFFQTLAVDIIQQIATNLRRQVPMPTEEQFVDAFRHYYLEDTFITL